MVKSPTKHVIYLELDSFFDTRLGSLISTDQVSVSEIISDNKWHTRKYNDLRDIDIDSSIRDRYIEIYKNRDKRVLKLSPITNIHIYLRSYVKDVLRDDSSLLVGVPYLVVNTFPYELTERERGMMKQALIRNTKISNVELIYKTPHEIYTVSGISNYDVLVIYNYKDFLEQIATDEEIYKKYILDKVLIIHDLLDNSPEDGVSFEEAVLLVERSISSVIKTITIPAGWFSSYLSMQGK